jgi:hypothetical protein
LRIPCDVTLTLALEPRHPAIDGGDELEQVLKGGLIRSGWHGVSFRQRGRDTLDDRAENSRK